MRWKVKGKRRRVVRRSGSGMREKVRVEAGRRESMVVGGGGGDVLRARWGGGREGGERRC